MRYSAISSRSRAAAGLAVVLALASLSGCRPAESPVARLDVQPLEIDLGYPKVASLRFSWLPLAPLEGDSQRFVFVHLLDQPGSVVRTFDHALADEWQIGKSSDYEIDLYQSALGPPLAAGTYQLSVGLYDGQGRRWTLETAGEEVDRREYAVASVRVPEAPEEVPMFYFSPSWLPIEGGSDLQILGRRWLAGEGEIRVGELPEPGIVWLVLRIPQPRQGAETLVLDEGANQAVATVTDGCGGVEVSISGGGVHEVELPIQGEPLPSECVIGIRPNFRLVSLSTLHETTLLLENLAWKTGPARAAEGGGN